MHPISCAPMTRNGRLLIIGALSRLGYEEQARHLYASRTARGRRGLKDDRQLAFFMASVLTADSNCIDVGANQGAILAQIVALAPEGQHLAFEPLPQLASSLRERFPMVDVRDAALADTDGETTFYVSDTSDEWSGIQRREWLDTTYREITVPVRTLDESAIHVPRVDFLKIDVEGAQVLVLRGAEGILSRDHPMIWIEHGARSAQAHNTTSADLWEVLRRHGYRVWTADGDGPLDLPSFIATNEIPIWTYMAHR